MKKSNTKHEKLKAIEHLPTCSCGSCNGGSINRKDFLKAVGLTSLGLGLSPVAAFALQNGGAVEMAKSKTVATGKAQRITLLHTADIHGQVTVHDEFFWENEQTVFKKRGGFAHLKSMINTLRKENPNTLLLDGGDCFQGSAIAALSEGQAMIPLMNNIGYDLMLPGNWEVVYGKKMLIHDMGAYHAPKVCANMFHDQSGEMIFPPYHTFYIGGIKIGFVGYNDPLTPIRQSPAYSNGIKFSEPGANLAKYVQVLREQEECDLVIAMTHMGLAQQLHLSNQNFAEGVDYIFGADTHERIRQPLQGTYSKVTEPGSFASFVGKMDLIIEDGKIKDQTYELLEVDPEKYAADEEMEQLVAKAYEPYNSQVKKVIGKTTTPLLRYFVIETPMDNLITDALMWKAKPDIALSNGFRFCPPLVPDKDTGSADITLDYLWSMLPVDSDVKTAEITGQQLKNWLEHELENVFAKDATKRFGGWLIRFNGMELKFTIGRDPGKRIDEVKISGHLLDISRTYTVAACEREGDPDSLLCRIKDVKNARHAGYKLHDVMIDYLAVHSPVAPKIEGRAIASDAPSTLLTQAEGVNYKFR
ncbi:MAG TPA: bifunctional metallophosphatase/5'-nucleotidase [Chitinophagales bacterium]|nr:bifunctional metallophosphatase/5'-nucleotidase [Chitinophagales bacterium]